MIRIGSKLDIEKIVKLDLRVSGDLKKVSSVMCNFSGVYVIFNKITGEYYIGSSKNILRRLREHIKRPKGLLRENFSKYDRLKDFEYILPIQKYSDIIKYDFRSCEWLLFNDIIYKYIMFYELNLVRDSKMFLPTSIRHNRRLQGQRAKRAKTPKGVRGLPFSRCGYVNTCWYKDLESLYIKLYKPSLNTRKIVN